MHKQSTGKMNTKSLYKDWLTKLQQYQQQHLVAYWNELDDKKQKNLISQLENIDFDLIRSLHTLIDGADSSTVYAPGSLAPAEIHHLPKNDKEFDYRTKAVALGEEALRAGKVGVILVAGGQSSRLQYEAPKGVFPVGPVTKRSLFQYHTEKIRAMEKKFGVILPWYIMTNTFSLQETEDFFRKNNYFGKQADSIHLFSQRMLPPVDANGKILMEAKDAPAMAPDGHGGLLDALASHKLFEDMRAQGLDYLFYFQVDNPLIKICDPMFIGCHIMQQADISAKTVKKSTPEEKLGNIAVIDGGYAVIEYTELTTEDKNRTTETGDLVFGQGSIGIHVFQRKFLEKIATNGQSLPFHVSHKTVKCLDAQGRLHKPDSPNGYKFEQFIFDAFTQTKRICVVEAERSQEFSPIKNKEGTDSPDTARRDLCNYFGAMLEKAGYHVPKDKNGNVTWKLEISPLVALDANDLGERLPTDFSPHDELVLEE